MTSNKNFGSIREIMENEHLSRVFFAIANGVSFPTEIAKKIGKTKYTVSMHLLKLKRFGLIKKHGLPDDQRKKQYAVNWRIFSNIFYVDHRLELELYQNNLFSLEGRNVPSELSAKIVDAKLVISGDGKLGLLACLEPERDLGDKLFGSKQEVEKKMNRVLSELIGLLKVYVTKRTFSTIRQCLLTLYKELEDNCKTDKQSELLSFVNFSHGYFSRIYPFEQVWEEYSKLKSKDDAIYFKDFKPEKVLIQFYDAGWVDYAGECILAPRFAKFLKPGTKIVVYPSYTYRNPTISCKGKSISDSRKKSKS